MPNTRIPLEVRFWSKVQKGEGCWEWTGHTTPHGYGMICMGGHKGKNVTTHRVSYMLHHGAIPSRACVLHKCDNRKCVRPDHLYLGTQADNVRDMYQRNRQPKNDRVALMLKTPTIGSMNGSAKLTEGDVQEIRQRSTGRRGEAHRFAEEFGVNAMSIYKVLKGKTWKHVTRDTNS
jgi:hypothetical protein